MVNEQIARNRRLIAQLEKQIRDDGMSKPKGSGKRGPVPVQRIPDPVCTCPIRVIGGVEWKMGNPDCLRCGTFNKVEPEFARKPDNNPGAEL